MKHTTALACKNYQIVLSFFSASMATCFPVLVTYNFTITREVTDTIGSWKCPGYWWVTTKFIFVSPEWVSVGGGAMLKHRTGAAQLTLHGVASRRGLTSRQPAAALPPFWCAGAALLLLRCTPRYLRGKWRHAVWSFQEYFNLTWQKYFNSFLDARASLGLCC